MNLNVLLIGANGGIGKALHKRLAEDKRVSTLTVSSRGYVENLHPNQTNVIADFANESSIEQMVHIASKERPLDVVIVATGILHDEDMMPEKSITTITAESFQKQLLINTIGPALVAKYAMPKLNKNRQSIFATFSARVGSISDNKIGGWYSYRASKSALNMFIKTLSIEMKRKNKQAVIVGLHPGTVDTNLSKPFQKSVTKDKLFTPEYSAEKLLHVLEKITQSDSGKVLAWDGKEIPA